MLPSPLLQSAAGPVEAVCSQPAPSRLCASAQGQTRHLTRWLPPPPGCPPASVLPLPLPLILKHVLLLLKKVNWLRVASRISSAREPIHSLAPRYLSSHGQGHGCGRYACACTRTHTHARELLCSDLLFLLAASPCGDLLPSVCFSRTLRLVSLGKGSTDVRYENTHFEDACKYLTLSQVMRLKVLSLQDQVPIPGQWSPHSTS